MKTIATLGSLATAACLLAPGALLAQTELTLSTPDPATSEITVAATHFAELVAEKTGGEVTVQVFPDGTLYGGDPSAAVRQLASGSLDMLLLSTSLYANFNPKFSAISIPYLFADTAQLRDYLGGAQGEELTADLEEIGIQGLGLWTRPFRQITNSQSPITAPADLEGLSLRVPNNPLWVEFFGAMEAVPTPMAFAEVYNALQLGVVDAQENPVSVPLSAKFFEVQDYLSLTNHIADAWVLGINPGVWESLEEAQQAAIEDAAVETEAWKAETDAANEAEEVAQLEANGMEVNALTEEQAAAFAEVAQGLHPAFAELVGDQAFFDATLAAVGRE